MRSVCDCKKEFGIEKRECLKMTYERCQAIPRPVTYLQKRLPKSESVSLGRQLGRLFSRLLKSELTLRIWEAHCNQLNKTSN